MSRIGKLPIRIPENVQIDFKDQMLTCKGPKGELARKIHDEISISTADGQIRVERPSDSKMHRSLHGLTRSLVFNMVTGVFEGYTKKLEIVGVGYRAEMKGPNLMLTIGYSHPIVMSFPEGVKASCPTPTEIVIEGIDKELVGRIAAKVRGFRKPEPYKGKGIRYSGEYVRRKAGKTAV